MEGTNPKPFVFVLMPFRKEFDDIYKVGIKPACEDAGAYCERVDEQIFVENILERVYNQIAKADIIVAEMSGRNPNVFYETGYAHALNKRVIMLTQNSDDIPFDLKHYPHIIYGGSIATLKTQLEVRVRWCVENPLQSLSKAESNLQFFVNGIELINHPEIPVRPSVREDQRPSRHPDELLYLNLSIDLHNQSNKVISPDLFDLALIVPKEIQPPVSQTAFRSSIRQSGRIIVNLQKVKPLFPDGWDCLQCKFAIARFRHFSQPIEITLRQFTEVGTKDFRFAIKNVEESEQEGDESDS